MRDYFFIGPRRGII